MARPRSNISDQTRRRIARFRSQVKKQGVLSPNNNAMQKALTGKLVVGQFDQSSGKILKDISEETSANIKICRKALASPMGDSLVKKSLCVFFGLRIADNFRQQKDSTGRKWPILSLKTKRKRLAAAALPDVKEAAENMSKRRKKGETDDQYLSRMEEVNATYSKYAIDRLSKGENPYKKRTPFELYRPQGKFNRFGEKVKIGQRQVEFDSEGRERGARPGQEYQFETAQDRLRDFINSEESSSRIKKQRVNRRISGNRSNKTKDILSDQERGYYRQPLIDTGDLFTQVTGSMSVARSGLFKTSGQMSAAKINNADVIYEFYVDSSGKFEFLPKKSAWSRRTKKLFDIHNRPVTSMMSTGPKSNPSKIPGREFLYINKEDEKAINGILQCLVVAGGKSFRRAYRRTKTGKISKAGGGAKYKTISVGWDRSAKAFGNIASDTLGNREAGALLGQLLRLGFTENEYSFLSPALYTFITEARSIHANANRLANYVAEGAFK